MSTAAVSGLASTSVAVTQTVAGDHPFGDDRLLRHLRLLHPSPLGVPDVGSYPAVDGQGDQGARRPGDLPAGGVVDEYSRMW